MKKSTDRSLEITKAAASDLPQLLSLYTHLTPEDGPLNLESAADRLAAFHAIPNNALFVGYVGDVMVSSCALAVIPNLTRGGRPYGLIENVVTHGEYRSRGYGKMLLSHALDHAWHHDCYKVMLMTGSHKPETHAFYRAVGFEASKTGYQIRRIAARQE